MSLFIPPHPSVVLIIVPACPGKVPVPPGNASAREDCHHLPGDLRSRWRGLLRGRRAPYRGTMHSCCCCQYCLFVPLQNAHSIIHFLITSFAELHLCRLRLAAHLHGEDPVLPQHGRRRQGRAHGLPRARTRCACRRRCGLYLP